MKCEEIFAALALLEKERGIPQDFMLEKIVQALVTAYKRDHEDVENVVVDVNEEKHDLKMFVEKTVVEEVENPAAEISAEEAKALSAKYHVGDTVKITEGPLASFTGTVEEIEPEKNKVRVVVSMFGRETPVELELDQVEVLP